jgi:hypothetical protein
MKARQLIIGAVYSPETIKVILKAFEDTWAQIAHPFYEAPASAEAVRLTLADCILAAAREDSRDPEQLKNLSLQAMALDFRVDGNKLLLGAIAGQWLNNSAYWRHWAEETLTKAEQTADLECKRLLMGVAQTYGELARHAAIREAAASTGQSGPS